MRAPISRPLQSPVLVAAMGTCWSITSTYSWMPAACRANASPDTYALVSFCIKGSVGCLLRVRRAASGERPASKSSSCEPQAVQCCPLFTKAHCKGTHNLPDARPRTLTGSEQSCTHLQGRFPSWAAIARAAGSRPACLRFATMHLGMGSCCPAALQTEERARTT